MENNQHVKVASFYKEDGINTEFLADVALQLGEDNLLKTLNSRIENSNCSVEFAFDRVTEELQQPDYQTLMLVHHWLRIPKSNLTEDNNHNIKQAFDAINVIDEESHMAFEVYLSEGPYANTINEVDFGINQVLIPFAEKTLNEIGITEFELEFIISKGSV